MKNLANELYFAVSGENEKKVRKIIAEMSDINEQNSVGESPLALFKHEKDLKFLKILLDRK